MNSHMNARLTALGRVELVRRVLELGQPASQVAASSGVCVKTVRKWVARRRGAPGGRRQRSSGAAENNALNCSHQMTTEPTFDRSTSPAIS